jgi:hypothetical protein
MLSLHLWGAASSDAASTGKKPALNSTMRRRAFHHLDPDRGSWMLGLQLLDPSLQGRDVDRGQVGAQRSSVALLPDVDRLQNFGEALR